MKLEVLPTDDGRWGLYVNGVLLGSSKLQCDALLARNTLHKAITEMLAKEPL